MIRQSLGELPRILIYCHNVHGLGHVVRSLRIAAELRPGERCECRLVTGCRFLDSLDLDPRLGVVRLAPLRPAAGGRLATVDGSSLGVVLQQRAKRIAEELAAWQPHVVLVDHNPLGLAGELVKSLEANRVSATPALFVWGVRDIWGSTEYRDKLKRQVLSADAGRMALYHAAIAYTDDAWLDTFGAYHGSALPERRASLGFITGPTRPAAPGLPLDAPSPRPALPKSPLVVSLSGGGAQAEALMALLVEALGDELARGELRLRFVVGPFTPEAPIRERAAGHPCVEVWASGSAEAALEGAALVVSRVGYNTAYSIVKTDLPIVFVPIEAENGEQSLRAQRLAELPAVACVDLATPATGAREPNPANSANDTRVAKVAGNARPAIGSSDAARLGDAIRAGLAGGRVARPLPFSTDGARRAADWLLAVAGEALGARKAATPGPVGASVVTGSMGSGSMASSGSSGSMGASGSTGSMETAGAPGTAGAEPSP